jgi:hypothetical protein
MPALDPDSTPSFCPWPRGVAHRSPERFRWTFHGSFRRKASPGEILIRRLFPSLVKLPEPLQGIDWRGRPARWGRRHELKWAA